MRWAEVTLVTSSEAADAVTDILLSERCGGVASADPSSRVNGQVKQNLAAYFPVDERLPATLDRIKGRVESLSDFGFSGNSPELTVKFVEDEDWATAWKSFFKPLVVGKIVVKPTWEDFNPKLEQIIVELDPGMAFGTGNHPTTQMCLKAVQTYLHFGDTMLDVGTGSGILAIAAALLGALKVIGIDIDSIAVKAAIENVKTNGVEKIVEITEADSPTAVDISADLVTANIVASTIISMRESLCAALKPGGILIASGIIDERRSEVENAIQSAGMSLIETICEGEWVTVIARKN
ncbi:MAG: 50S ribosomal protein L11 methyltransferase [Armatimonadota bacterium]|nr:50S ribosomal protein L11 methyltransferase [Armatimonadota bacterium]